MMHMHIGQRLSRRAVLRFGTVLAGISVAGCAPSILSGAKALSDEEWASVVGSNAHLKRLILQFQNQSSVAQDGSRLARIIESNMALADPLGPQLSAGRTSREEIIADRRAYARFQERERARAPIEEIDEDLVFALEAATYVYSGYGVLGAFRSGSWFRGIMGLNSFYNTAVNKFEELSLETRSDMAAANTQTFLRYHGADPARAAEVNEVMALDMRLVPNAANLQLSPEFRSRVVEASQTSSTGGIPIELTDRELERLLGEIRDIVKSEFGKISSLQSKLIRQQSRRSPNTRKTRNDINFAHAEAAGAVVIGGFILGTFLKNQELGQNFVAIGNALNDAYRAASLFMMEPGGIGTLAFSGSMVTAGLAIHGAISGKPDAAAERHKQLMEVLEAINENILQMRDEMHERFDRLELGQRQIVESVSQLSEIVIQNDREMFRRLKDLEEKIDLQRSDTDAAFRGQINSALENTGRDVVSLLAEDEREFEDTNFRRSYNQKLNFFLSHAEETATQHLHTLYADGKRNDTALIDRILRTGRLDRIVGQLPHMVGAFGARVEQPAAPGERIVNPIEWARGAESFLQCRLASPRSALRHTEISDIKELLRSGRRCRDTINSVGQRRFITECHAAFSKAAREVSDHIIERVKDWENNTSPIKAADAFTINPKFLFRGDVDVSNGRINYSETGHQFSTSTVNDPVNYALVNGFASREIIKQEGRDGVADLLFAQNYMNLTLLRGHPTFRDMKFRFRIFRGTSGARVLVNAADFPLVPAGDTRPWKEQVIEAAGGRERFAALLRPMAEAKEYMANWVIDLSDPDEAIADLTFSDFMFFNLNYLQDESRKKLARDLANEIVQNNPDHEFEDALARFEELGVRLHIAQRLHDWRTSNSRLPEHYRISLDDGLFLRRSLSRYVGHRLSLTPKLSDMEIAFTDVVYGEKPNDDEDLAWMKETQSLSNYIAAILPRHLTAGLVEPHLAGEPLSDKKSVPQLNDTLIRLETYLEEVRVT